MDKKLFFWGYFILGAIANFSNVLLPIFFLLKGMDESQVAFLLSSVYLAAIFQPILGYISDVTIGSKNMLKVTSIIIALLSILLFFASNFTTLFLATFLFSIFRNITFPLFDNICLEYAHTHDINYGKLRKGGSFGFGFGVLFATPFVFLLGKIYIILMPALLALTLLFLLNTITFDVAHAKEDITLETYKINFKILMKSKTFILLTLINLFIMSGISLKLSYQSTLLQTLNAPLLFIVVTNFFVILPELLLISKSQNIFKRTPLPIVMTITLGIAILHSIILLTTNSLLIIFIFAGLHGITMGIYIPIFFSYLTHHIPKEASATGFIINGTFQFMGTLLINTLLIGPLVAISGLRASFLILTIVFTIGIIPNYLLLKLTKKEEALAS